MDKTIAEIKYYKTLKAFIAFMDLHQDFDNKDNEYSFFNDIANNIDFGEFMDYHLKGHVLLECMYVGAGEFPHKIVVYSTQHEVDIAELEGIEVDIIPSGILSDETMLKLYIWDNYEKVRKAWQEKDEDQ